MTLLVSVIIPVFRDWDKLKLTLSALEKQTLPKAHFEVIVVDNDESPLDKPPIGARYLHAPQGWSYAARNAGVAIAQADTLAFTDADCLPAHDWLESGVRILQERPEIALVGGRIDMIASQEGSAAQYDCYFGLPQREYFESVGCLATANMFVRRATYDAVGGFDAALESGGDFKFCRSVRLAGFKLGYADEVVVKHPARASLKALVNKTQRIARGWVDWWLRYHCPDRPRAWRKVLWSFRPRLRDWCALFLGRKKASGLKLHIRMQFLAIRVLLHYVRAVELTRTLHSKLKRGAWP